MSYAVKVGTTEAVWIDNGPTPPGWVRYDGAWDDSLLWDDAIQNLRMPNEAESLAQHKAERIAAINAEATSRIISAYPLEKQSSALMGVYPTAYRDQMTAEIAAVIQASNAACDSVTAAADVAGVDAVVVNWPVIGA